MVCYRNRNWVFTSFRVDVPFKWERYPIVRFAEWQLEQCPTTQKLHYQGYIVFEKQVTKKAVDDILFIEASPEHESHKPWCEGMKGSISQSNVYCTKGRTRIEGPWQYGQPLHQGKSMNYDELAPMLIRGCSEKELFDTFGMAFIRQRRYILDTQKSIMPERMWKTELHIRWGVPDGGKSYDLKLRSGIFTKSPRNKWWCGYRGQEEVLIDDFDGWIDYKIFLQLADFGPLLVETKGGMVNFCAKKIYVTANDPWVTWWPNDRVCHAAVQRRITTEVEYKEPWYKRLRVDPLLVAVGTLIESTPAPDTSTSEPEQTNSE